MGVVPAKEYMENDTSVMVVRASVSWFGVALSYLGVAHWSDAAAFLASVYTLVMLGEWAYKRLRSFRTRYPGE